jgi:hypothetical protein
MHKRSVVYPIAYNQKQKEIHTQEKQEEFYIIQFLFNNPFGTEQINERNGYQRQPVPC